MFVYIWLVRKSRAVGAVREKNDKFRGKKQEKRTNLIFFGNSMDVHVSFGAIYIWLVGKVFEPEHNMTHIQMVGLLSYLGFRKTKPSYTIGNAWCRVKCQNAHIQVGIK